MNGCSPEVDGLAWAVETGLVIFLAADYQLIIIVSALHIDCHSAMSTVTASTALTQYSFL